MSICCSGPSRSFPAAIRLLTNKPTHALYDNAPPTRTRRSPISPTRPDTSRKSHRPERLLASIGPIL
jgi:hypothetical protein